MCSKRYLHSWRYLYSRGTVYVVSSNRKNASESWKRLRSRCAWRPIHGLSFVRLKRAVSCTKESFSWTDRPFLTKWFSRKIAHRTNRRWTHWWTSLQMRPMYLIKGTLITEQSMHTANPSSIHQPNEPQRKYPWNGRGTACRTYKYDQAGCAHLDGKIPRLLDAIQTVGVEAQEEDGKIIFTLTNDFERSAKEIGNLYSNLWRWSCFTSGSNNIWRSNDFTARASGQYLVNYGSPWSRICCLWRFGNGDTESVIDFGGIQVNPTALGLTIHCVSGKPATKMGAEPPNGGERTWWKLSTPWRNGSMSREKQSTCMT